jgi:copper(I)-binding protein
MKMMPTRRRAAATLLPLLLLAASCGNDRREPAVEEAWIRLPAANGQPGAAYFRLEGNIEGTRLTGITSPLIRRVELHETVERKGISRMEKRKDVEFPSRGALVFEPGGRHAMLFGIGRSVVAGGTVPLTFSFNTAPPVTVDAEVRTAAGEAVAGAAHNAQDHGR